ncbi:MAG: bifunctional diguanylate cyclase/phosphodiesterase [Hyphomicrobiales bacterium]|nr:bifunctional diguanylate cyclase/phosphodiesterase [Hyphomicrobiales bacterium]
MNPFKYRGGGLFAGVIVLGPIVWLCLYMAARIMAGGIGSDADGVAMTLPKFGFYAGLFSALVIWGFGTLALFKFPAAAPAGMRSVQAERDPLSSLIGRKAFLNQLDDGVIAAESSDTQLALVAIDLDRFKSVNDIWGHATGDEVLRESVFRIRSLVGSDTLVARMSGDEFAVMIDKEVNPRSLKHLAQRIIEELSEPFEINDTAVSLGASVGVALYPVNADSGEALFRAADLALAKAKADGAQVHRFFDTAMENHLVRRSTMERDLRLALQRDEFVVFYQPQMDLKSGDICGYEALIRWERPGEGIISPMDFIPVAEETGLIKQLGEWILRKACQDGANWISSGIVAVNFSAEQFRFPGVDEMIRNVLEETGLDPQRLEIEITESLFLNHSSEIMATLRRIKALGVRIAMDDFGTGYSSLSYLTRFPFDKIKIDRSFVGQLSDHPQIGAIISSIVGLGRSLSVDITAEGVETNDQVTLLQAAGCSIVQGFLFGAPQRADIAAQAKNGVPAKTETAQGEIQDHAGHAEGGHGSDIGDPIDGRGRGEIGGDGEDDIEEAVA